MHKVCTIITVIFLTLLFAACSPFTEDIEDYLSYWSTQVAETSYSIDNSDNSNTQYPKNKDGVLCVPSAKDVKVTIKLRNPKNLTLKTIPTSSDKVIRFPGLSSQPVYETDYTLEQTARDTLILTYKKDFLKAHEAGKDDIGPEITFIADDGRIFDKRFSLNLKADTPPVLEYEGRGKTSTADADGNRYYVLLFHVKDMDTPITDNSVHRDINALNVTMNGGTPVEIPLTLNTAKTDFATDGDLLAASAVEKLNDSDQNLPQGAWILRLKTNVKVDGPATQYAVSVTDKQGLSSRVIAVSTDTTKLPDVQLFDGSTQITGTTEGNPKICAGMTEKVLTVKAAQSGAEITGKIEKQSASDWNQVGSNISGMTTAQLTLPALDGSENEVLYKITLKATLTGYVDSDETMFFVKLVRQEIPVLKLMQNFNVGDTALHCISAAAKSYVSEDIIPDAGLYTSSPLVIYTASGTPTPLLEVTASAGTMIQYKLNNAAPVSLSTTPAIITLSGTSTGVYALEIWAERGPIVGPHTTVHFKVINAVTTYTELKNVVQNTPKKGTEQGQYNYSNSIDIKIDADLTASADTEIAVTDGKKLILQSSASPTVRTVDANNNGRIFKISGTDTERTELTLKDIELKGGNAVDGKGGAVCVEAGGTLVLFSNTVITPSTTPHINTPGKNDVYLADSANIGVDPASGSIDHILARITPAQYVENRQVLTNTTLGSYCTKFSVTQPDGSTDNIWIIKDDRKLAAISKTITEGADAWKKLRELVKFAPADTVITIDGEIKATPDGSGHTANYGPIGITKNLTIKGKKTDGTDTLNANKGVFGHRPFRIFNVRLGAKLTLENLTLTGGKAIAMMGDTSGPNGGGILVTNGTVNITNCTITGNEAGKGGAVYLDNGTFTMKGSSYIAPGTEGKNDVYLADGKTITVDGRLSLPTDARGIAALITTSETDAASGYTTNGTKEVLSLINGANQADGSLFKLARATGASVSGEAASGCFSAKYGIQVNTEAPTKGIIAEVGSSGSVQPYEPSPYTFELTPSTDPISFSTGQVRTVTFTLKKKPSVSGGSAQPLASGTQFTLTMELYQNGSSLASLGDGKGKKTGTQNANNISITLPAYLPAGTYQLHLKAEVGGQVYDGWRTVTVN